MPVYQFICLTCKTSFEKRIAYENYGLETVHCTACGSTKIQRKISKIRFNSSNPDGDVFSEDMPDFAHLEQNPEELGRTLRKMGQQTGEQFEPEFDEVVDRLEKGQSFDQIEQELPDISATSAPNTQEQSR
ncbi:MAG TPA: hypothetical protein DCK95_05305 [Anaerolineaceae bacterium]|uniref:Putative regulatory protein FmdB zinc ribbon domain-containing protein n=1 Tax=Anaerolinea thermophila TaxID=167964 RepID=A0A117LH45_9CHLR|nr:MAG: hypothetical protein XD73_0275 [Anaerolinea thermophila]HAF61723.1 hypothetical protein [Anaerolineaceae bacterium]